MLTSLPKHFPHKVSRVRLAVLRGFQWMSVQLGWMLWSFLERLLLQLLLPQS